MTSRPRCSRPAPCTHATSTTPEWLLAGAISLPFVVEGVAVVVPVHGPVVDPLWPFADNALHIHRYVVERNDEVGQSERDPALGALRIDC